MRCDQCGSIIDDNSISCPYCGKSVGNDYFGYESAARMHQANAEAPAKKDNSVKIVFIILGVLFGIFAIALMAIVMSSNGADDTSVDAIAYEGSFTVQTDFDFCISDSTSGSEYTIKVSESGSASLTSSTYTVDTGETISLSLNEGTYTVVVSRNLTDTVTLEVTASSGSQYNYAELQFDNGQIQLTNGGSSAP
ncbi:MAG: zinc ribbon domain-containing protein [Clostridiales bacterium]|nr:zinc ribbon domain-containing protein [Clostridiales bacterium]